MKTGFKNEGAALKNQSGFTLIEMLVVVIVLGILAMIIIPQITVSTDDAKLKTLQTNLNTMRNAIELYYHQHNQVYPGAVTTADPPVDATAVTAALAFPEQLTRYTKASGATSVSKTGDFIYGPYIKTATLPKNPFTEAVAIVCVVDVTDITSRTADGGDTDAWKFNVQTGVFIANDSDDHATY